MKKVVSLKSILMILLSLTVIGVSTQVFATGSVLETGNNTATTITSDDYNNAAAIPVDTNYTTNNTTDTNNTSNNVSNGINTSSAYNTVDEEEDELPQTGIEDYNIGILLIICVAAAIYTYKKMKDYKNI